MIPLRLSILSKIPTVCEGTADPRVTISSFRTHPARLSGPGCFFLARAAHSFSLASNKVLLPVKAGSCPKPVSLIGETRGIAVRRKPMPTKQ